METTGGLLDTIKPPRLEDAGLEDCALPPEAIEEAFLKSAKSIKCRAASILYGDNDDADSIDHLDSLGPSNEDIKDMLLGIPSGVMEPCGTQKMDGIPEISSDQVLIGKENVEASDGLLGSEIPDNEVAKACVEGIQGLEIGEKGSDVHASEEEEKDMETTGGLLDTIKPPRLEDCALPPEAIEEAFLKAANSIKCRAACILYADDDDADSIDHLDSLRPSNGDIKDMLLGIPSGGMELCGTQKMYGIPEMSSDQVLVGKENVEASDR